MYNVDPVLISENHVFVYCKCITNIENDFDDELINSPETCWGCKWAQL